VRAAGERPVGESRRALGARVHWQMIRYGVPIRDKMLALSVEIQARILCVLLQLPFAVIVEWRGVVLVWLP
jgi:hypothetical protein